MQRLAGGYKRVHAKLATVEQEKCKVLKRFSLDLMMDYDESILSNERQISKMGIKSEV